jgi:hypothetical protein
MPDKPIDERADEWLTEEIRGLLGAIRPPHVEKKRRTVLLVAFAKANGERLTDVFGREDTCAESIWWRKWNREPDIRAALEACEKRALEWADQETVHIEARYRNERRRTVARWAAEAPNALASVMADKGQRGSDRINAAVTLVKLADPAETATVGTVANLDVMQAVNVGRFEDALKRAYGDEGEEVTR